MAVKARFWVQSIKKTTVAGGSFAREVFLQPVVRSSGMPGAEGNVDWSKYTPSGEMRLVVTADGAGQWFEDQLGKDVAIIFDAVKD